jgi:3-oxoacyl-[acyl-carrier-protein] synthase-3
MAKGAICGVRIAGMAAAVPKGVRTASDDAVTFGEADMAKMSHSTGVLRRRIAGCGPCSSDLCYAAASRLLQDSAWSPESVDVLIVVTQTPDYLLPATSCVLHGRLGVSPSCAAFDLNLACSGYGYGLWVASRLIGRGGRASSWRATRSVATPFGDTGSATALEARCPSPDEWYFDLGTDGTGCRNLIVPAGGFRAPRTDEPAKRALRSDGNTRSEEDLFHGRARGIQLLHVCRAPTDSRRGRAGCVDR